MHCLICRWNQEKSIKIHFVDYVKLTSRVRPKDDPLSMQLLVLTIWGRPEDVSRGRPQAGHPRDVILQSG